MKIIRGITFISIFAFPLTAAAQLPKLSTENLRLTIPLIQVDSGESYATKVELIGSDDLTTFSLAAGEYPASFPYNRGDWSHWEDFDSDCQNTRHELLIDTSEVAVTFTRANNCTVSTGQWLDPYTGDSYTLASDLDIDHVIPLKYAHDHGGAVWSAFVKMLFANDPENLLAVDDVENSSKSARGPSEYMPPDKSFHCEYARKWQFISTKYDLELDLQDREVINQSCTG